MDYNFETFDRGRKSGGGAYTGASIKKNHVYLTKSLLASTEIEDGMRLKIEVDEDNDAFRLAKDENGFKLSRSQDGSGASLASKGAKDNVFHEVIGLPFGRYELVKESRGSWIFEFSPHL